MMNVSARAVQLITEFEGSKPRLTAEMCEGGAYELGWGSTYHLDGRKVQPGECATLEYAIALRAHALGQEMKPVWPALKVVPTQNQVDAIAPLAYNIGGTAAAGSSVVRFLNEGRIEDAAAAFGMWTGSTSRGPAAREVLNGTVPDNPKWDQVNGELRWLDADGKPCDYFRRFRGLLRRQHAEGCLFLGYHWSEATKNDAIAMRTRLEWNESKGRWEDQIIYQTPFSEVLEVARNYPLAPLPEPKPEPKPMEAKVARTLTLPDEWDTMTGAQQTAWLNTGEYIRIGGKPEEIDKPKSPASVAIVKKVIDTPNLKPDAPAKPMEESLTHKGLSKADSGKEAAIISTTVLGGVAYSDPYADKLTAYVSKYPPQTIFMVLGILAAMGALYGLWRWWAGKMIAEDGRRRAEGPKV